MPFRILGEPWKTLGGLFGGILGSGPRGQAGVEFLFRDDFITDEAAPLTSPRTAEPGPGQLFIKDTANNQSVVGSELVWSGVGTGMGDPGDWTQSSFARAAGLSAYVKDFQYSQARVYHVGFDINQTGRMREGLRIGIALSFSARVNDINTAFFELAAQVTPYELFVNLRNAGFFGLVRGGVFTDWTLLWVGDAGTDNPVFATITTSSGAAAHGIIADSFRVSQLPSPWDTDYGIATDRLAGARAPGDTFVHEADCLIEFTIDSLGAGNMDVSFRIQDATNLWTVRATGGGNLVLRETIGGVENVRAFVVAVLVGGERIVIIADDETIRGYYDNTLAWTYALAANFKTETAGELIAEGGVGGSASDIILWPRRISGLARRALDRIANV